MITEDEKVSRWKKLGVVLIFLFLACLYIYVLLNVIVFGFISFVSIHHWDSLRESIEYWPMLRGAILSSGLFILWTALFVHWTIDIIKGFREVKQLIKTKELLNT